VSVEGSVAGGRRTATIGGTSAEDVSSHCVQKSYANRKGEGDVRFGKGPRWRQRRSPHPAVARPGALVYRPSQNQLMWIPEIAREITNRWISDVPSKMV
jgi:hypothetical protein